MGAFDEFVDHITNGTVFIDSCKEYYHELSISLVIITISMIFMVIAGFDYMCGNRLGLGEKYVEGWEALPSLALAMVGITAFTPVLRIVLEPLLSPVYKALLANPSMFAGTLLACDMGGYPLAVKMAGNDKSVGYFSGCILASMMGATIVFNIPVGISLIPKERQIYFAYGTLLGILTIPFGCIAGGGMMNTTSYKLSFVDILKNLIPVIIIAVILCLLLFFFPHASLRGFIHFSGFIKILCTLGAVLAIFQEKVIIKFPLLSAMVLPEDNDGVSALYSAIMAIGEIAIMLTGTLPMVFCINKYCGKYLAKLGKFAGLDEIGSTGIIACLTSSIPMYQMFHEMSPKSMIVNSAFSVGGAFILGDHLAYIGAVQQDMIVPMMIGKLVQGLLAIVLSSLVANYFIRKIDTTTDQNENEQKGESNQGTSNSNTKSDSNNNFDSDKNQNIQAEQINEI